MERVRDLSGMAFGKLKVLSFDSVNKHRNSMWLCKCECGKIKSVLGNSLTQGKTKSCGCSQMDKCLEMNHTHNMSKTRIYRVWSSMKGRCYRESSQFFHCYGERGIEVCDRWRYSFENFYNDMGPSNGKMIERINNDLGYSPENCRWATHKEQARNKRSNFIIEFNGERRCLADWAVEIGIKKGALYHRIRIAGWEIGRALTEPVKQRIRRQNREGV